MSAAIYTGFVVAFVIIARLVAVYRGAIQERRHTDSLTALLNRPGFEALVTEHLKRELPFSIVWLNLDGFRKINELHGYSSGDILLTQVGPRIQRCLRTGDAVARFGGDQFLILLRGHEAITGIVVRILRTVTASAGVSLYPDHATNSSELLLRAETAMRQAKANTRGGILIYQPSMAATGVRAAEIASLIESALTNNHFRLVYQPIVNADGEIVRLEALVRIEDPILGRIAPLEFIGVAEQTGLIEEVGAWILRHACQQAREWRDAGLLAQLTINLSPLQVASVEMADRILSEITRHRLVKSAITLHITGAMDSCEPVKRLRAAGIRISSTEPLFDEIRVKAPFAIPAHNPGLTIIAQGIEKPEEFDRALEAGCHLFQGFQIAPPLEPSDASEILRNGLFSGARGFVGG
jgi:predicted signal transduction protein with EAL and GGDEF domain